MTSLMESRLTPEQHELLREVLVAQTEAARPRRDPRRRGSAHQAPESPRSRRWVRRGFVPREPRSPPGSSPVRRHRPQRPRDPRRHLEARGRGLSQRRVQDGLLRFDLRPRKLRGHPVAVHPATLLRSPGIPARRRRQAGADGVFVCMESLDAYTDCHEYDPVWERFRSSLRAIHERVGSNANIGKALGRLLTDAGLADIQVRIVLCSPTTVGWKSFRAVVRSSADLAFAFFPELFDRSPRRGPGRVARRSSRGRAQGPLSLLGHRKRHEALVEVRRRPGAGGVAGTSVRRARIPFGGAVGAEDSSGPRRAFALRRPSGTRGGAGSSPARSPSRGRQAP